jgi:alpha-glucosidase
LPWLNATITQCTHWNRYGDSVHDQCIARLIATTLLTSHATAMTYCGAEIGIVTTTAPTRREDVKDPIGITGWPKEKGRDGEPSCSGMTRRMRNSSTAVITWHPVAPDYTTINVKMEEGEPDSLLNWKKLTACAERSDVARWKTGAAR